MSLFAQEETLCNRENNACKRREKCLRYMQVQGGGNWIANYWQEFGKFCEYFKPMKKKEIIDGPLSKARES